VRRRALLWLLLCIGTLGAAYGVSVWLVHSGIWSPDERGVVVASRYESVPVAGAGFKTNRAPATGTSMPRVRLVRSPYIQWTTPTSAHIVWDTDSAATSEVEYVLATAGSKPYHTVKTDSVTRHIVKLSRLQPDALYRYRIGSNGRVLASGQFRTVKRAGQPFSFVVWGDSGMASRGQFALARQIESVRPDFLLHTGDLIYPSGAARDYNPKFFNVYRSTLARAPFYGSLGNHDVRTRNGQPFLTNFVLPTNGPAGLAPERNYSFDYADAHVAVLDTNASIRQLRDIIVPWLRQDMANSKARWKFAVFHHPPYSSGLHGDDARTKRVLDPVLRQLKIDIVFNGHDHHYERWKPKGGVTYIVTGAGGAVLYPRKRVDPATAVFSGRIFSYTRIDIAKNTLRGRQISVDGATIDDWRMVIS
jgi:predicted phosphodiesterase